MLIMRMPGTTRNLGAPEGCEDVCVSLPIIDTIDDNGFPVMVSCWEPTPEEAEALANGARILLLVQGKSHPMVNLVVKP